MISFAGLKFQVLKRSDVLNADPCFKFLTTANAEIIVRAIEQKEYFKIVSQSLCCFDGQIPYFLAKLKYPFVKFEKISGSDLIYDVSSYACKHHERLFLLGGNLDANKESIIVLKEKFNGLELAGFSPIFSPYPFSSEIENEIINHLINFRPHYLFVGFGAQKQERWIYDHRDFLKGIGVKLAVGSGGTFEFVSGKIRRAPWPIQRLGLEGIFRFLVEPSFFRFKRLLVSLKIFLYFLKN